MKRLAVVGAGPVGLETARAALDAGFDVRVYEAGRVGEALRRFEDLRLFTPFALNSTAATRERLIHAGVSLPPEDALLTAAEHAARYLDPLAALPELSGRIRTGTRVTAIARDGLSKPAAIPSKEDPGRARRPFLLRVETAGAVRFERADAVVDASGVLGVPLATGPGGLEASGERTLGDRVDRWLLPFSETRRRYQGRRALLVGDGHSAATALAAFDAMARSGSGPLRVLWVHRDRRSGAAPFTAIAGDILPARAALVREANRIAQEAPWLARASGAVITGYEEFGEAVRVALQSPDGEETKAVVDRVYALAGYRPDLDLFRELQIHLCYASEAPMALAAALLAGDTKNPATAGDCLVQVALGPETLRTTEPDFFVLGAKSYGRRTDFLLRAGLEQAAAVCGLLVPEVESTRESPSPGAPLPGSTVARGKRS